MPNDKTITMPRGLAERILSYAWFPSEAVTVFDLRLIDREELSALLAAPVVERQEPVAWQRKSKHEDGRWFYLPDDDVEEAIRLGYEVRKLYTSPPAPVSVVLPKRFENTTPFDGEERGYDIGWNGYDDEFKRLNPSLFDKVKELNQ